MKITRERKVDRGHSSALKLWEAKRKIIKQSIMKWCLCYIFVSYIKEKAEMVKVGL